MEGNNNNPNQQNELVNLTFPRALPKAFIELEEKERQRRMTERTLDPVSCGKLSRVHQELLSKPLLPLKKNTVAALKTTGSTVSETMQGWMGSVAGTAHNLMETVKDKLHLVGGDQSSVNQIHKLEEQERARRLSQGVDPIVSARKHVVEEELKQKMSAS